MTKKKWALLILCLLLLTGYYKLFYKTYSEKAVAKSADCIAVFDVKRIVNTLLWNLITTPGQWKKPSFFSYGKDSVSLDDMVKFPDYIFIFHTAGQPANAWYIAAEIKDADNFSKGLKQYQFQKEDDLYVSKKYGIVLLQNGAHLLIGNLAVKDKNYMWQTATELFVNKQYCNRQILEKNVSIKSHLSVQIKTDDHMENHFIAADFDEDKITVAISLPWKPDTNHPVNNFLYNDSSICTLAFTQPYAEYTGIHSSLTDSSRAAVSKAVNFNIDSLILPTNNYYQLDVEGIYSRMDSAISYSYDDNFNPVKKVVANIVEEPAFNFSVQGNDVNKIYQYWKFNDKLEATSAGELFTPMPFAKSYCAVKNEHELLITSSNYKTHPMNKSVSCILFFKLLVSKIPASLMKYLPDEIIKVAENIASLEVVANNEKGMVIIRASINKKKNDLPVIEW
jgi:hypothetical protein